ncbi:uncharacterized protein EV422DRAFT_81566 [Fimicolochytrium jonesii]|uniref:uncharacterized protein n=1 Tax=Fimicolochytrium jonesii TaxID=1396493 RepID=UPI0022FE6EBD|nr:uncharacterized protein EV422DRAFT_81566 [Fimicolochytrium jonesii]KAI8820171.1 hypothetical protein EV422DRAFT_81566 [Fimicolochytrium jonesii]
MSDQDKMPGLIGEDSTESDSEYDDDADYLAMGTGRSEFNSNSNPDDLPDIIDESDTPFESDDNDDDDVSDAPYVQPPMSEPLFDFEAGRPPDFGEWEQELREEFEKRREQVEREEAERERERREAYKLARQERKKLMREKEQMENSVDAIHLRVSSAMTAFNQDKWVTAALNFSFAIKEWENMPSEKTEKYPYSLNLLRYLYARSLLLDNDPKRGPEILGVLRLLTQVASDSLPFVHWAYGQAINQFDKFSDEVDTVLECALEVCTGLPDSSRRYYPSTGDEKVEIPESDPHKLRDLIREEQAKADRRPKPDQICQHEECAKPKIFWEKRGTLCARVTCNAPKNCSLYYHKSCWRGIEKRVYGLSKDMLMGQECPTPACDGVIMRFDDVSATGGFRKTFSKSILYEKGQQPAGGTRGRGNTKKIRSRSRSGSRRSLSRRRKAALKGPSTAAIIEAANAKKSESTAAPPFVRSVYLGADYGIDGQDSSADKRETRPILKQYPTPPTTPK